MMVACYCCDDDVLYILMKLWTLYACTYVHEGLYTKILWEPSAVFIG